MLRNEIMRLIRSYSFWLLALGIGVLKVIAVFNYHSETCRDIFLDHWITTSIFSLNLNGGDSWGKTEDLIMSLCAFAVSGIIIDDIQNDRYQYILTRESTWKYSISKMGAVFIGSFFCMMIGDILFYGISHLISQVPIFPVPGSMDESNYTYIAYSDLLSDLHFVAYSIFKTIKFSCFGVFMTILTMLVALWVHDRKFIVVLPVIFMYVIGHLCRAFEIITWKNIWFAPWYIYVWGTDLLEEVSLDVYAWDDWKYIILAFGYTLLIAIFSVIILHHHVERWKKG